jgi:Tfp pilus assembly protein PilV
MKSLVKTANKRNLRVKTGQELLDQISLKTTYPETIAKYVFDFFDSRRRPSTTTSGTRNYDRHARDRFEFGSDATRYWMSSSRKSVVTTAFYGLTATLCSIWE